MLLLGHPLMLPSYRHNELNPFLTQQTRCLADFRLLSQSHNITATDAVAQRTTYLRKKRLHLKPTLKLVLDYPLTPTI